MYIIRSKNGIMMSVGVSVKNWMIGALGKMIIGGLVVHVSGLVVHVIASAIKHVKLMNFYCSCGICLSGI